MQIVKTKLWKYGILGAASFLPPILSICIPFSYFAPYLPADETSATWFQRSGSLMVAIALIAEFYLVSIQDYFDHNNTAYMSPITLPKKYKTTHKCIIYLTMLYILIGTIIWGYGDAIV